MTDLKQLTEWSRKFLADNTCYVLSSDMAESCLFHKWHIAPVLMQLGKREMEKRGFEWCISSVDDLYQAEIGPKGTFKIAAKVEHENEYIAFWSAVMQAIKEK